MTTHKDGVLARVEDEVCLPFGREENFIRDRCQGDSGWDVMRAVIHRASTDLYVDGGGRRICFLLILFSVMLNAADVVAQPVPGVPSQSYVAICEQQAASIRDSRSAFENHINTPYLVDVIPRILAPGGFIDRHAGAMDAWAEKMRSKDTTTMEEIGYIHNGGAAYNAAFFEVLVHMGGD